MVKTQKLHNFNFASDEVIVHNNDERESKLVDDSHKSREEHDEITSVTVREVPFTLPVVKQAPSELIPQKYASQTHSDDKVAWKSSAVKGRNVIVTEDTTQHTYEDNQVSNSMVRMKSPIN